MEIEKTIKHSRLMNAFAIFSASFGVVFILLKDLFAGYESSSPEIIIAVPAVLILNAVAILLLNYLRSGQIFGFSPNKNEELMREELSILRKELKNSISHSKYNERLYYEVEKIKEALSTSDYKNKILTEEEKTEILHNLKREILENTSEGLLIEIEKKHSVEIRKDKYLKDLRAQCELVRARLTKEIDALGRRGNLNLVIGVITTISAVTILASTILSGNHLLKENELITYYIPRLTLSIFIEIFSFFFLKLYKAGLGEIKYFQNELTNVELKFIAAEKAVMSNNEDSISQVIKDLASTERNFKLEKGESTVDLEKYKTDQASNQKIMESLAGLINNKK